MRKLAKALIAFLACWIVVVNMFMAATHASRAVDLAEAQCIATPDECRPVHWTFLVPAYAGAAVGLAADVAFNLSAGTVIYREFPQELLFTARSSRHLRSAGWRRDEAEFWCYEMDRFDGGHCDGVGQ